jgi:hypothetical protein
MMDQIDGGALMTLKVVHVRQRSGASAKRVLAKSTPRPLVKMPPVKSKPPEDKPEPKQAQKERSFITAAPDGPSIAVDLPEKHRKLEGGPVHKALNNRQLEILNRIVQKAGDGHAKTLGLRLVLAASEDDVSAAWPIGTLSRALRASGRSIEGDAVHKVAYGCRVSRYRDMAANALAMLNDKIEIEAAKAAAPGHTSEN